MTEIRELYDTGDEIENWPEMMIGPPLPVVITCPRCGHSEALYRAGKEPDTGRVLYWCITCRRFFTAFLAR